MKITMVLPTYNEADNLTRLLPELMRLPLDLNVLVVDDNSPDGTGTVAEGLAAQYPGRIRVEHRQGKRGFGAAYIHGFKLALADDADVIGQMDSDFSHPPDKLPEMVAALEYADIVIGSRYVEGGGVDENWPWWRKRLSAWGSFYARLILGVPLKDQTGGFRLWSREVLTELPLERVESGGYVFQVELAYLAHLMGFTFKEVPIYFKDRQFGESKMDWRIGLEAAWRVWTVRYHYQDLKRKRSGS
jgi:dolichol-phosphate mannosyltransferase